MSESGLAASGGQVPTQHEDIQQVFKNHYEYYQDEDGEIAHQQQSGESAIRRAYSGRMVFELLQNAIDRAEDSVEVQFRETDDAEYPYQLIVANDGTPVRVDPAYPYDNPPDASHDDAQRPDFNALCSVHTSNKSQDESIGTKGSGFRSVFSIDTHVRVWSRFKRSGDWWGLEMHSPINKSIWCKRRENPDIGRGIDKYLSTSNLPPMDGDEERPSYHFPFPLSAETPLSVLTKSDSLSTGVIVPVPADAKSNIEASFEQLKSHHLYFTGLAQGNEGITVEFDILGEEDTKETDPSHLNSHADEGATWAIADWQIDDPSSELAHQAEKADLDITYPGAAIAWPPHHPNGGDEDTTDIQPAVYGYLPTVLDGPFGTDLHGDFKLSIDRTNVRFDDNIIGPYNTRIAEIGAELHVLMAIRTVPELVEEVNWEYIEPDAVSHSPATTTSARDDFWSFLNPDTATSTAGKYVKKHVEDLLFDLNHGPKSQKRYTLWAQLASEFFEQQDEWPIDTYDSFWETNLQWVDYMYDGKTRGKNWSRIAKAMCDAFREFDAAAAPIVEGNDAQTAEAISLPPSREAARTGGSTARKERELYIWNPNKEEFHLSKQFNLPTLLKNDDRVVTTYNFNSNLYKGAPNPLGATEFTRWQVLDELRQLPNSLTRVDTHRLQEQPVEDGKSVDTQQCELIRFAAQLYQLDTGGSQEAPGNSDQYNVGWRMRPEFSENAQRAGRSLATLFLPIKAEQDDHETNQLWAPARQLTRDQVAVDQIRPLPETVDIDAFLAFLGVAPAPPNDDGTSLTLVEGGFDGCVEPQETPPPLAAAERGPPDATLAELQPANRPVSNPDAWRRSIQSAYEECLKPLIRIERETATSNEDTGDTEDINCWTNLIETLGNWPWYPVTDSETIDTATPPQVGHHEATAVRPTKITVHSSRQTRFPKLLYGLNESADSAPLLIDLGAINGLDTETLQEDNAQKAYRLLNFLEEIPPSTIDDSRLRQTFVDLYNRLLESIVVGDEDAGYQNQLSLLVYNPGEKEMALSERQLTWRQSCEHIWIAKERSEQRTIHQHFPTIPLVAATIAPTHIESYELLSDQVITLTKSVQMEPAEGISDDLTNQLFNQLSDLVPQLLALADATSNSSIDRSNLTTNWGPDRFRRAEDVWYKITTTFDGTTRPSTDLKNSKGVVLITTEEPQRIVFDTPDGSNRPPLSKFGEPLAELLLDRSVSDLFARALHMAEEGDDRLNAFLKDRGAKSLVPMYQTEFDPLSSEEHAILVEEVKNALDKLGLSLETTSASQLRILRPDDIMMPDTYSDNPADAPTQDEINELLDEITLPDSRDWEGYRPQFRCIDSHYNEWQNWFERHQTYLLTYLLEFLEEQGVTEYSEASLEEALDEYARYNACQRIAFQPEDVVPSWLATLGITNVPDSSELLEQAKRYESSFKPVTEVKDMEEIGISPGELTDPTISQEQDGSTITPEEATRTKRAQMAYGEDAEQAALNQIVGTTSAVLKTVFDEEHLQTVFGEDVNDLQDAVDVLCWPFYDGGVTETHIREHMADVRDQIETHGSLTNTEPLRNALHISTVWDGAGFDIIGLACDDGQLYPVRYEIKSLSDAGSSTVAHLSQKQYAVYKEVHNPDATDRSVAGDWRLFGVTEHGDAIDITAWLENLPDDALTSLRSQGFKPDGLVLARDKDTGTDSTT